MIGGHFCSLRNMPRYVSVNISRVLHGRLGAFSTVPGAGASMLLPLVDSEEDLVTPRPAVG